MLNMYHRISHLNIFRLTDIERRVRDFILDRAVRLLQSFKSKKLPKTVGDIESGFLGPSRTVPTDHGPQYCPGYESSRGVVGILGREDHHVNNSLSIGPIELGADQQQRFTKGPARFITANDGSSDCMALFVTKTLFAKLRDLHQDSHHLLVKQGQRDHARGEVRRFDTSIRQIKQTIEMAENQAETVELRETLRQHERRLLKLRQRGDELEDSVKQLEGRIKSYESHIQWTLHNAMQESDLLEPHRPVTSFTMTDTETESRAQKENDHGTVNEDYNTVDIAAGSVGGAAHHSAFREDTDVAPKELQCIRQEAWESYNEALVTMHKVQSLFDNRQHSYETDLAEYQRGFANGNYNITRSEFDRSKIRYEMNVTRALITAEEAFEIAKEHAQAVDAIGDDYDDALSCYSYYQESWPASQLAFYLATKDWSHVSEWLLKISERGTAETRKSPLEPELKQPELDDWYGDEVDPADSISQVDFNEWRKDIDRWEGIRFEQWEDMRTRVGGPEVQVGFLVRSTEFLKRRHSTALCGPKDCEWERST